MKKLAIFASGFGSNFQAIKDAIDDGVLNAEISILVSDKPNSFAVERAKNYNIKTFAFNPKNYKSKQAYELDILNNLKQLKVDLIILAGYMRIIGNTLLENYENSIINIHPSLLPNFKGKDAIKQAFIAKAKKTGVTIHYVNKELDSGKTIAQEELDISEINSLEKIESEIHKIEHRLYPRIINKLLEELYEKSFN